MIIHFDLIIAITTTPFLIWFVCWGIWSLFFGLPPEAILREQLLRDARTEQAKAAEGKP